MTFSKFINKLYNVCANGNTPVTFLRNFLKLTSDEYNEKIMNKDDTVYRKYFNECRTSAKNKRAFPKSDASYIFSHLDSDKFEEFIYDNTNDNGLIELCHEFEQEIENASKNDIIGKLEDLYRQILKCTKNGTIHAIYKKNSFNSEILIEQSLANIVTNLSKISPREIKSLIGYNPSNVDKKIYPENALLKDDVKNKVVKYYLYIEKLFKEASKHNSSFFDDLANAVKFASDNYISQGLSQQIVYDNMTQWFKTKAYSSDDTACRTMVAFFIQNCEVFHEITE